MVKVRNYVCRKMSGIFKKKKSPSLPIEKPFSLPSALPSWPAGSSSLNNMPKLPLMRLRACFIILCFFSIFSHSGEGFATGTLDLGAGLQLAQVTTFTKIWAANEGGPDNRGAAFFEPTGIPNGFSMLGGYSQPNNKPLSGWVLVGKDTAGGGAAALKPPTDYSLVWSSEGLKIKQDGVGYIWVPIPPDGYKAVGHLVTSSPSKPDLDRIRCVRLDLTDSVENEAWIWGSSNGIGINIYTSRPRNRGVEAMGVPIGTFLAQNNNGGDLGLVCLKKLNQNSDAMPNFSDAMPNSEQVKALMATYAPRIYFHPNEQYFPSSVQWFFENGALLYTKGNESSPVGIDPTGSNLPRDGTNDGAYWIDLPTDNAARERVKKGDLSTSCVYIHVKPMFGGTFTDIAIWMFYPFNGPARAKVELFDVGLGKIGEHVGDWEHVTLRISNVDGGLKRVYFAQHSKGVWADASELEYVSGNKTASYASLHGHAAYPKEGLVLQGNGSIGIRNDSKKSKFYLETGDRFVVIDDVAPVWVRYEREWGPKVSYSFEEEMKKVEKVLPGKLKSAFDKAMRSLPNEVLGEEGPTGPKGKDSWSGDERS